jgi:hypothetical protein
MDEMNQLNKDSKSCKVDTASNATDFEEEIWKTVLCQHCHFITF